MLRDTLSYRKGSYRKFFIFVLAISFCIFIYSSFNKDVSFALISLGSFFVALKQVVIPIDLNQNITLSEKKYSISDDDLMSNYNSDSIIHNNNENKIWHKLITLGDKISFPLCIAGIIYSIFF